MHYFSDRANKMRASEIREILKFTQQPDVISFAGGLPNPTAFPKQELADVSKDVILQQGEAALQYGTTEGLAGLREDISKMMKPWDINAEVEEICITEGSQQGLELLSKVFLNPGDNIIVGAPSYLGALNAFRGYEANMAMVPLDDDGMRVELLEDKLIEFKREYKHVKFIYLVPTFQNPAGVTMKNDRRKRVIELAEEYDTLIIEDNPYGELRYHGEHQKTIYSMDPNQRTIYLGTFSKILSPGMRLAWIIAPKQFYRKIVIAKQSVDLCTTTLTQYIAHEFMQRGLLQPHIEKIKKLYGRKRELMLKALDTHFPEGTRWTKPNGGMFCWATLPEHIDAGEMFPKAIKEKVAYITGSAFHADRGGKNTMRLNYTHANDELIDVGIERLAKVIEAEDKLGSTPIAPISP
jgi:2-aminoadipate transaminase